MIGDNDPALKMAAAHTGVCYVSLQNGYMSKYYAGRRALSRRHYLWPMIKVLPNVVADYLVRTGEAHSMKRIHQPFERLRRRYGLGVQQSYLDEMEGDRNLLCDLPELFPQKTLPSNYLNLGPLIYDEFPDSRYSLDTLNTGNKTIYVNMGSTGDWNSVQFLNDPYYDKYNIVTAGDEKGVLGSAVLRFSFLPGSVILPRADLVICHGGNGIINQALYYQKPILCKTNYFEQEWNTEALQRRGWGRSLDGVFSTTELREIVDLWISGKVNGLPKPKISSNKPLC